MGANFLTPKSGWDGDSRYGGDDEKYDDGDTNDDGGDTGDNGGGDSNRKKQFASAWSFPKILQST